MYQMVLIYNKNTVQSLSVHTLIIRTPEPKKVEVKVNLNIKYVQ